MTPFSLETRNIVERMLYYTRVASRGGTVIDGTAVASPELVDLKDEVPVEQWAQYRASGMAELIGSFHLCNALSALVKTGMSAQFSGSDGVSADELFQGKVNPKLGAELLRYLAIRGCVTETDGIYQLTNYGAGLISDVAQAQFGFYYDAYGPVTTRLPELLLGTAVYGEGVLRDGRALGENCATLFHAFHTETVLQALAHKGGSSILDLGCGAGAFLIDACKKNPAFRGVGLDISAPAIEVARKVAQEEGLSDRVHFVVGDAFAPATWPEICKQNDLLCAVGVVHEHFRDGEDAVISVLNTFGSLLDLTMKGFILGEPELWFDDAENDADLYLVHIFTKQGYPRRRQLWLDLFPKTNLQCLRTYTRSDAGPRFNFFDLVRK